MHTPVHTPALPPETPAHHGAAVASRLLERLAAAYREYFGTRPVGHPPVLAVNTGEVDFVNRIDHRERLITRLSRPWTGVRIFDPDSFVEEQAR